MVDLLVDTNILVDLLAIRQLIKSNLSHNIDLTDALIAAASYQLNLPIYTRNIKHFFPIIPDLVK